MAEIAVRPKKGRPGWGFIGLLLLAFIFIVVAVYLRNQSAELEPRSRGETPEMTSVAAHPPPEQDPAAVA